MLVSGHLVSVILFMKISMKFTVSIELFLLFNL
jgi:hypothetical protein